MKIELHSDEAAPQEQSLGNKVSYSSQDILPIYLEKFHRLIFPFVCDMVTRSCRLQVSMLHHSLRHLVEHFP